MKGVLAATVTPRPGEKWCLSAKRVVVVVVVEERTKDKALHPSIHPSIRPSSERDCLFLQCAFVVLVRVVRVR